MNCVSWALLGMAGYSIVTMLVKLATRSGSFSSFLVLAIATSIVALAAVCIALVRGDFQALASQGLLSTEAGYAYLTGIALAVAVTSLFRALSLGPATIVVSIYGMFIVGGALLGILFLGESLTWRKALGIAFAIASVVLIAGNSEVKN